MCFLSDIQKRRLMPLSFLFNIYEATAVAGYPPTAALKLSN